MSSIVLRLTLHSSLEMILLLAFDDSFETPMCYNSCRVLRQLCLVQVRSLIAILTNVTTPLQGYSNQPPNMPIQVLGG